MVNSYNYSNITDEIKSEGLVLVQFIVDGKGLVTEVNLLKNMDGGYGEEVARVLKDMNDSPIKWFPGKLDGVPTTIRYFVPVKFNSEK